MQAASPQPFSHVFPAVLLLVFAIWCISSYVVSLFSGWHALATRFRAQSEPAGPMETAGPFFYTIYLRSWTHYNSVVRVTAAQDALYLSVLVLFRFAHPPLRIPWEEITFSRARRFWRDYVVLTLGREERVPLRISERMARKLGLLNRPEAPVPSPEPNFGTFTSPFSDAGQKDPR